MAASRIFRAGKEGLRFLGHLCLNGSAFLWRTLLFRTTVIAITGSFGKTTAKDCLAAILETAGPTMSTRGGANGRRGVAMTILRARPRHRFLVIEVGTDRRGGMLRGSLLIRPGIAVILRVAKTHTNAFKTLDITAFEKASLLRFLSPSGSVVLNADDPRVEPMAALTRAKPWFFSLSKEAGVTARDVRSHWPGRLELTVSSNGESATVRTALVGTHWAPSVLAAITAARACGVGLEQSARALEGLPPHRGRLQPCTLSNGAVILRDEVNGSIESLDAAAEVLRTADARRRILVISDCSDFKKTPRQRRRYYANLAAGIAEAVVFLGDRAHFGVKYALEAGMPEDSVHACLTPQDAADFLKDYLRSGDLVLLRGRTTDHLTRVYLGLLGTVGCRRAQCGRRGLCENCPEVDFVPGAALTADPSPWTSSASAPG